MRYAFFGTTQFSADVLRELLVSDHPPVLVITNPDRPAGRKQELTPPPVKPPAEAAGIPVWQVEKPDAEFAGKLRAENLDCAVLAAYGHILRTEALQATRLGVIGVHVSLLPKYRGASPMQSAILAGEKETGVTLYLMDEEVDHGPILAKRAFPLTDQTFLELQKESAKAGAELLIRTLPGFAEGRIKLQEQDHSQATFTRKFSAEDGFAEPEVLKSALSGQNENAALEVWRKIRALNPEPGAWSYGAGLPVSAQVQADKRVKLISGHMEGPKLVLEMIQPEGKTPRRA